MHDAVERHMTIGTNKRPSRNWYPAEVRGRTEPPDTVMFKLAVPAAQYQTTQRGRNERDQDTDEGRPDVAMAPTMEDVSIANHADEWLDIHRHLGDSEYEDAEVPPRYSFKCQRWAHVEWRERHGRFVQANVEATGAQPTIVAMRSRRLASGALPG